MARETMKIAECPLCGESHQYELEVERKVFSGLATQPQTFRRATFDRSLECPDRDGQFEVTIKLSETTLNPIVAVQIVGIMEEDAD